jgi:alkylation response protein AidB-like acyl-CoA dehydrogenase
VFLTGVLRRSVASVTFDLTAQQAEWSRRARDFSQAVVAGLAQAIDERGVIPDDVRDAVAERSITNPFADGAISASVVLEEIASVSAGVATAMGLEWAGYSADSSHDGLPGLRGSSLDVTFASSGGTERVRLVLCAVAIGVGRAAVAQAVDVMKSRGIRPSGDEPTPHWALADAAAELDAARLLTLSAAQVVDRGESGDAALSLAARLSAIAAERAVEAASLIEGPGGYCRGSALERLTRDARTLKLLLA